MSCGEEQPSEGVEELGLDNDDLGTGRIKQAGVGDLLQGGGTKGYYIWVGYMGDETPHGKVPGGVSA